MTFPRAGQDGSHLGAGSIVIVSGGLVVAALADRQPSPRDSGIIPTRGECRGPTEVVFVRR